MSLPQCLDGNVKRSNPGGKRIDAIARFRVRDIFAVRRHAHDRFVNQRRRSRLKIAVQNNVAVTILKLTRGLHGSEIEQLLRDKKVCREISTLSFCTVASFKTDGPILIGGTATPQSRKNVASALARERDDFGEPKNTCARSS